MSSAKWLFRQWTVSRETRVHFPPRNMQKLNAILKEGLDKLIAMLKQISGLTEKCTLLEAIENMSRSP